MPVFLAFSVKIWYAAIFNKHKRHTNMTNFLRFNTGRQYSAEGQRIECALIGVKWHVHTVVLEDYTRGLSYVLYVYDFEEDSIMRAYDTVGKDTPTLEQREAFETIKNEFDNSYIPEGS